MKILVTGCMGFIGSNLVPMLLNLDHHVIGLDNLSNNSIRPTDRMKERAPQRWQNFKFYKGDVCSSKDLFNVMHNYAFDCVVHLAAVGSVPRSFANPVGTAYANEMGFVNLLQMIHARGIKRLVYASSSSVYGDTPEDVRAEGREGKPLSPYALSKKTNEEFARVWATSVGIETVGLRFFNVYGPGQLMDSVYSAVIPKFINEPEPVIFGDGLTTRDFTYVDDVCRAILKAIKYTRTARPVANIFNVGTGKGTSLNQLASLLGKRARSMPAREHDIRTSIACTQRAREILEFKAEIPIAEGLRRTQEFYRMEAMNAWRSKNEERANSTNRAALAEGPERQP